MPYRFHPVASLIARTRRHLHIDPKALPRVYAQVLASAEIGSLDYWLEIIFSAGIATFGLVLNSPAVIIGAMLISPLMGPIMAAGLTLAVGDVYLGFRSVVNLMLSIAAAISFSALLVWLLPFHSPTPEIIARINPNLLDLGTALLSGLAGTMVVCRGGKGGGVTALPGVAIAVALMPPLCAVGFGLGSGANLDIMGGAGLLFLTNLVAIVACAFAVFLAVGMSSPDVSSDLKKSREETALPGVSPDSRIGRILASGGQLRWRVLMLLLLLAAVAVPLRKALIQVASETAARGAIQDALKGLVSSDAVVSQQVRLGADSISIRLISTQHVPADKISQARDSILARTGRKVDLSVDEVASKSEMNDLMSRLAAPAPQPPRKESIAEIQKDLMDRVRPAIEDVWPSAEAPIQDFALAVSSTGLVLNVNYQAPEDLGEIPTNMILRSLQTRLSVPDLTLNLQRIPPPKPTRTTLRRKNTPARK